MFANLIFRRTTLAALSACALWPAFAQAQDQAQDQPINVYYEPLKGGEFNLLNKAIQAALSQPPLRLADKAVAGALVLSVPDKVQVEHKRISGTYYSFNVAFARDGSALGQSQQSCNAEKLSDCTDQLVLDVKSVVAPR